MPEPIEYPMEKLLEKLLDTVSRGLPLLPINKQKGNLFEKIILKYKCLSKYLRNYCN
jgi:hypothetical protein